jgi:uncharacterized membrane protein
MKLRMQSLFLKIFFWFWATAIVTGIALIVTFIFGPGRVPSRWHSTLTDILRNIKYALRSLCRAPAFSFFTILTIALGIGATTIVFTVVNPILLHPAPGV